MKKNYTSFPLDPPGPKGEDTIWLPMLNVRLGVGFNKKSPMFPAIVDSGSPHCLFRTEVSQFLGIDLDKCEEGVMGGITGQNEPVYYHNVKLIIENNWSLDIMVGFMRKLPVTGLLGRSGFFDNFLVTFDQTFVPPTLEVTKIERSKGKPN